MQTWLKVLALVGKVAGVAAAIDPSVFGATDSKVGLLVFLVASIVKDTVNRIGDLLDNNKMDDSFAKE